MKWGFPKIGATLFGVLFEGILLYLGYKRGTPILGSTQMYQAAKHPPQSDYLLRQVIAAAGLALVIVVVVQVVSIKVVIHTLSPKPEHAAGAGSCTL